MADTDAHLPAGAAAAAAGGMAVDPGAEETGAPMISLDDGDAAALPSRTPTPAPAPAPAVSADGDRGGDRGGDQGGRTRLRTDSAALDDGARKRGRRMFQVLVGTLQSARSQVDAKTQADVRRETIEQRTAARIRREKEEAEAAAAKERTARAAQRAAQYAALQEYARERVVAHREAVGRFIATRTQPPILFAPAVHTEATRKAAAASAALVAAAIKDPVFDGAAEPAPAAGRADGSGGDGGGGDGGGDDMQGVDASDAAARDDAASVSAAAATAGDGGDTPVPLSAAPAAGPAQASAAMQTDAGAGGESDVGADSEAAMLVSQPDPDAMAVSQADPDAMAVSQISPEQSGQQAAPTMTASEVSGMTDAAAPDVETSMDTQE